MDGFVQTHVVARISFALILLCAGSDASSRNQSAPQQTARLPEFEVATVKASDLNSGGDIGVLTYPGGRVHAGFCTLKMLVGEAFDIKLFLIQGGPKWMDEDRFHIDAIPPDSSATRKLNPSDPVRPMSPEQRQMLQALLIDRFALKYHFETRRGRVYWLVKSGTKTNLARTTQPTLEPRVAVFVTSDGVGQGEMVATNASMPFIASRLSETLDFPVIDKTGIEGAFDFDIPPPDAANSEITDATIAGLKILGLRLKPVQGLIQVMVVDSASQPTPN